MKPYITLFLMLIMMSAQAQYRKYPPGEDGHQAYRIQVAMLLDASGSMDGLIDQAKSQLWHIVNDLSESDDYGQAPILEFALYEYGKSNLSSRSGYIRQIVPLTQDLDWLAEELFQMRTGGGNEYCGLVIDRSVAELEWSYGPRDLRMIYIAGNESFRQGRMDFRDVVRNAYDQGIFVNTIFCGDYQDGVRLHWEEAAHLGGGIYTNIDQNRRSHRRPVGNYQQLSYLNTQLNDTYLPYGSNGVQCQSRQREQDRRIYSYGEDYARERFYAKAGATYTNSHWDLVDAVANGTIQLESIASKDLPTEMRGMTMPQRKSHLSRKQQERKRLQQEIRGIVKSTKQQEKMTVSTHTNSPKAQQGPKQAAPRTLNKAITESVKQQKQAVKEGTPIRSSHTQPVKRATPTRESRKVPSANTATPRKPQASYPRPASPVNPGHRKSDVTQPAHSSPTRKPVSSPAFEPRKAPTSRRTVPVQSKPVVQQPKTTSASQAIPAKRSSPVPAQAKPVPVSKSVGKKIPQSVSNALPQRGK